jgi:hypothetical protein
LRHCSAFLASLDAALARANADYAAHRQAGQLADPRIKVMRPDAFAEWMRGRGKLGGQHKVPRIINDLALFDIRHFAAAAAASTSSQVWQG